jgi:hypothetical protein
MNMMRTWRSALQDAPLKRGGYSARSAAPGEILLRRLPAGVMAGLLGLAVRG